MSAKKDKYRVIENGELFELQIGINKYNSIVLDYGGKPINKLKKNLENYPYHANICAAIINHCNAVCKRVESEIKEIINKA